MTFKPPDDAIEYNHADHMLEDDFVEQLRQHCQARHWFFYHTYDSRKSREGFPDVVAISRGGRVLWIEAKRQRGYKISDDQIAVLDRLEANPANEVILARPRDLDEIIELLDGGYNSKLHWRDWLTD